MRHATSTLLSRSLLPYQLGHTRSIAQLNVKVNEDLTPNSGTNGATSEELLAAKPLSDMPGPTKFGLIRGFLPGGAFYKKPLTEFMKVGRKLYGETFLLKGMFGKDDIVVTFNPDNFRIAARSEGVWPKRRGSDSFAYHRDVHRKEVFQGMRGLLGTNGEEWGRLRSSANPILMQPRNVRLYIDKMQSVNKEFIQRIREIRDPVTLEMPADFENEINRLTFESIGIVALNEEIGSIRKNRDNPEVKDLFKNVRTIFTLMYDLDIKPSMWKVIPTPKFYQMMNAMDNMTDTIIKYINQAKERIEKESVTSPRSEADQSVLEKLLKIDPRFAVIMAFDMLMAGVDTTSTTLTGVLLCLAKNPEKQEKLREEMRNFLPTKDSTLTAECMKSLPYLRACIKEGIRLYPISSGAVRSNENDIVLDGYRIPKKYDILVCSNDLLREEKYFPKANEFIPERWIRSEALDALPTNLFIYTPFGFGPRSCVGKRVVDLELEITVARLVRNFYIEFNYSVENAFRNHLINMPAIPLRFKMTEVEN